MDPALFTREDKKYSDLWKKGYKEANWRRLASSVIKKTNSYSYGVPLVDFGFGSGKALDFFESKGFYVSGVEISAYAVNVQLAKGRNVYQASLDKLDMLDSNQFGIGFCNDVLEHISESLIGKSLDEMVRVCSNYLFISVCPTSSHHLSLDSENLHFTVKPESWWLRQFMKYGRVEKLEFLFSRSARYYININPKLSS